MTHANDTAKIERETQAVLAELQDQDLEAVTGGKDNTLNNFPGRPPIRRPFPIRPL